MSWNDKFQERTGNDTGQLNGILGNAGVIMNRTLYVVLWVLEVLMIVGIVVATALPVQDLALREYIEWQQHPSPETYTAFPIASETSSQIALAHYSKINEQLNIIDAEANTRPSLRPIYQSMTERIRNVIR